MLSMIIGYLLMGVVVTIVEELWLIKNSEKWFGLKLEQSFMARFIDYDARALKRDICDVLSWPIGIIELYLGINRIMREGKDIEELVDEYRKEGKL